ncbi:MAG: two-component system, OmpR family, sensor kinase [Solirubrobacteraceae bacterium]|jgi:two-component system OmpR family sensor kinase|nr:two-component system, OmpR family, sensor kinase [Solirubrobacteraceae bacterium]
MMASLRGRLIATLLALTTLGLVLLGGITYVEQRSFLLQRVDQQVRGAIGAAGLLLHGPDGDPGHRFPGGGGDPGGRPRGDFGPPPGTYVAVRDSTGKTTQQGTFRLDTSTTVARPNVPAKPPAGRIITVSGTEGTSYRLLATANPVTGGTSIVAVPMTETSSTLQRLLLVEGLVIAGVLAALAAVSWVVVRIGLLPLDRMGHTAGRIAGGDLSHRVGDTDPRTEVGRLGISLNAMLDRLERAFAERQASEDKLRQFLADASHELRTPLASIRGYAELFRMGAIGADADRTKALRRIEDEAARMGVLVEDLLMLARLDEVADAPHARLDLAPLVRDAVSDARAIAPERTIEAQTSGPLDITGDAHQLRQVLANLVRNALTHTPEGTPVEVSARREDGQVRLEIRDHGPGLPTADPGEIFGRFWRAEVGRTRGKGGAGLGLAIVAAIVDAHGGRVEASDAEGGGASFVVRLPAA